MRRGFDYEQPIVATRAFAAQYESVFYFCHIEGFSYLWFNRIPDGWSPTGDYTWVTGLKINEAEIESNLCALGGVCDPQNTHCIIVGDEINTLASIKRNRASTQGELLTQYSHSNNADLELVGRPAFPSSGVCYVGNQTIGYTSTAETISGGRATLTLGGIDRGKFQALNLLNLTQKKFPAKIKWDEEIDAAPLVTLHPSTMRGRVATIYRGTIDKATGHGCPSAACKIIFRGAITSFGDTPDHFGIDFELTDLLDRLNQKFFNCKNNFPLGGIALSVGNEYDTGRMAANENEYVIGVYEKRASMVVADFDTGLATQSKYHKLILTSFEIESVASVADFVALLDTKLKALPTFAPWFCTINADGKVMIGHDCVGYHVNEAIQPWPITKITKGSTNDIYLRINGSIDWCDYFLMLGFERWDQCPLINQQTDTEYKLNFGKYTNKTHYVVLNHKGHWLVGGYDIEFDYWTNGDDYNLPYSPCCIVAKNSPSDVFFDYAAPTIPSSETVSFAVPGDSSDIHCLIGDQLICRARSNGSLINAVADAENPRFSNKLTKGADGKYCYTWQGAEEQRPRVAQVWRPKCKWYEYVGFPVLALQIMQSTSNNQQYNGQFDCLQENWGLAISEEFIDESSFMRLFDMYSPDLLVRDYYFTKPENFLDWLNTECKTLGINICMIDGLITCIPISPPTVGKAASITIDATNRVAEEDVSLVISPDDVINKLILKANYDPLDDKFLLENIHICSASINELGQMNETEIEHKGIVISTLDNVKDSFKENFENKLYDVSRETYVYTCVVTEALATVRAGADVLVDDDRIINPFTGQRGLTGLPGIVISTLWSQETGKKTVRVRLEMDHEDDASPNDWLLPYYPKTPKQLAPSLSQWVYDGITSLTYPPGYPWAKKIFEVGDRIVVENKNTGEIQQRQVVVSTEESLEIDLQLSPLTPGDPHLIRLAKSGEQITQTALAKSFLADATGAISAFGGSVIGCKNG